MKTFKTFFEDNYIKFIDPATRKEVKYRASDEFINSIIKTKSDTFDSASYLKKIKEHGVRTGVFAETDTMDDRDVRAFYDFIVAAVPRPQLHNFLKELPRKDLQAKFKEQLNTSVQFSYLDILDTTCDPSCRFREALDKYPIVLKIRPAVDRYATRGAAGPGEAFLAFMFSGEKPKGAGDLALDDMIVELKANGGRIGKDLDSAGQSHLLKQWYPGIAATTAKAYPEILNHFAQPDQGALSEEDITMVEFLNAIAGPREGLDEKDIRFFARKPLSYLSNYPTYKDLIQLLGPIQMKHYFTKIKAFNTIAIFQEDIIIGFNKAVLERKNSERIRREFAVAGVEIMPKSGAGYAYDTSGYTIQVKI